MQQSPSDTITAAENSTTTTSYRDEEATPPGPPPAVEPRPAYQPTPPTRRSTRAGYHDPAHDYNSRSPDMCQNNNKKNNSRGRRENNTTSDSTPREKRSTLLGNKVQPITLVRHL